MTTSSTSIHFKVAEVSHRFLAGRNGFATLDIGKPGDTEFYLHFKDHPELIHAVIAHLVALENEMAAAAPVITDSEPAQTYGLCPSDSPLGNYGCTLEPGHGGMHQSVEPLTGKARAEWTAAS